MRASVVHAMRSLGITCKELYEHLWHPIRSIVRWTGHGEIESVVHSLMPVCFPLSCFPWCRRTWWGGGVASPGLVGTVPHLVVFSNVTPVSTARVCTFEISSHCLGILSLAFFFRLCDIFSTVSFCPFVSEGWFSAVSCRFVWYQLQIKYSPTSLLYLLN